MLDVLYSMCFTCCTAALTGSTGYSMLTESTRQRCSTVVMNLPQGQAQADALVRALGDEKNLVLIENTVRRCAHAVADGWMEAVPMPVLIGGVTVMGFTMCSQNYYFWSLGMDGKLGLPKGLLKALGLDGANGSGSPAKDTCSKDEELPKDAEAKVDGPMGGTTAVMAADALSENNLIKKLKIENLALLKRVAALDQEVAALDQANQALLERIARTASTVGLKKSLDFGTKDVGKTDLPKEASNEDWQI
jgi:hypothetical protein